MPALPGEKYTTGEGQVDDRWMNDKFQGCTWVFHKWGTPKWMVYNENPIKVDDLGVPLFWETSVICCRNFNLTSGIHSDYVGAAELFEP